MIRVESLGGDFSVGGYTLVVTYNQVDEVPPDVVSHLARYPIRQLHLEELRAYFAHGTSLLVNADGGADDAPGNEHELPTTPGFPENSNYWIDASIETPGDVDRYTIQSPNTMAAPRDGARMSLQSLDGTGFTGDVRVYDAERDLVASQILVRNTDTTVLQFGPAELDSEYFVEIRAASDSQTATGNYRFEASFGTQPVERSLLANSTINTPTNGRNFRLNVSRPQLFHFELDGTNNNSVSASLIMTIQDQRGTVIDTLTTAVGDVRTMAVYLPTGSYRISVRAHAPSGFPGPIAFRLLGASIDNPLGPRVSDPTTAPFSFAVDRRLVLLALFLGL